MHDDLGKMLSSATSKHMCTYPTCQAAFSAATMGGLLAHAREESAQASVGGAERVWLLAALVPGWGPFGAH
eukprot:706094-Pelagomonas_calceolata.AAC.1